MPKKQNGSLPLEPPISASTNALQTLDGKGFVMLDDNQTCDGLVSPSTVPSEHRHSQRMLPWDPDLIAVDVEAASGIIHVIDTVVLP